MAMHKTMDLVIAALGSELGAVRKHGTEWPWCLETGIGGENSARVLHSFLAKHPARMVWNIGFAGALSPSLKIGDLVIDPEINRYAGELLHRAAALQNEGVPIQFGRSIASPNILSKRTEKAALASSLSNDLIAWVDMESSAIASVCAEYKVPLFTLRCISDLVDEDLPLDLNRCFDSKGRLSLRILSKEVFRYPLAMRGLFQLYKRSRLCSERLASFMTRLNSSPSLT